MAGGLIDLVAYGVQDLYLTGDPQITFFKILYRRHTNFSIESIPQTFSSNANFGETVTCTLKRAGDLVGRIFLYVQIPAIPKFINSETGEDDPIKKMAWVNNLGYALVSDVIVEIAGKIIDKQYGEWLYIWSQVSGKQPHGLDKMTGNVPEMYNFTNGKPSYELYIPLEFWFCRNNGLALPLVALSASEVKIIVSFRRLEECYRIGPTFSIKMADDIVPFQAGDYIQQTTNNQTIYGYVIDYDYLQKKLYYIKINSPNSPKKTFDAPENNLDDNYRIYNSITKYYAYPANGVRELAEQTLLSYRPSFVKAYLYVNYVYLDNDERNKFARTNHEYLIEQIQFNQDLNIKSPNTKHRLSLNHPCKAIYFVAQLDNMVGPNTMNDLYNYTTSPVHFSNKNKSFYGTDLVQNANLIIDGRDRFGERTVEYFNLVEPYEHHYRGPNPGINVYSFGLNPEDHQPSSTMNMSEIENSVMNIKLKNVVSPQLGAKIRSYTINYNILRIYFNMGAVAFV